MNISLYILVGINSNNSISKKKKLHTLHICWTVHAFKKSENYEQGLTIRVQYYGYYIVSLNILTVSKINELQYIMK